MEELISRLQSIIDAIDKSPDEGTKRAFNKEFRERFEELIESCYEMIEISETDPSLDDFVIEDELEQATNALINRFDEWWNTRLTRR